MERPLQDGKHPRVALSARGAASGSSCGCRGGPGRAGRRGAASCARSRTSRRRSGAGAAPARRGTNRVADHDRASWGVSVGAEQIGRCRTGMREEASGAASVPRPALVGHPQSRGRGCADSVTAMADPARRTALLVAGTFFMENLDGTILTTAVPSIARSLHESAAAVGTAITAYLVTVAVLIPLSGWVTLRFGPRRVLVAAIALFTVASALCAASPDLGLLIAARVLQGAAGALMVPVGRLVVLRETSKADLVRVVALLTWPALAAPVIAPLLGGLLTSSLGWPWIFLVNLPLGAVALVAALRLIHGGPALDVPRLDRLGLLLVCLPVAALTA